MNAKISEFVICVEVIIYLSLHNLHDCTFNHTNLKSNNVKIKIYSKIKKRIIYIYEYITNKCEIYNKNITSYNMNMKHDKNADFSNISATTFGYF